MLSTCCIFISFYGYFTVVWFIIPCNVLFIFNCTEHAILIYSKPSAICIPPPHLLYLEILRMILLKIMKSGMLQKIVVIIIHVCILFLGVSVRMTDCNLFWFLL